MKISGIILAAGQSSRMAPGNKLLLQYGDHTVVEQVLLNTMASEVDEVVVITGCDGAEVADRLKKHQTKRVRIVHNPSYSSGRAESVRCGLQALDNTVEAALFVVGDKPDVRTALIDRTLKVFRKERPSILHVRTPSGRGHPIIFGREVFTEFEKVEGDFCANDILHRYRDRLIVIDDEYDQIDIDTEADYQAALSQLTGKSGGDTPGKTNAAR